jgi:hypothetical protein
MKYKFNIGDKVQINDSGSGFWPSEVGKIATITAKGQYFSGPGYLIEEKYYGNPTSGKLDGFVGKASFKLYKKAPKNNSILLLI